MRGTVRPPVAKAGGFLDRANKVWGRNCPDTPEKPHKCTVGKKTCTIGRKFWFSNSGRNAIVSIAGKEKRREKSVFGHAESSALERKSMQSWRRSLLTTPWESCERWSEKTLKKTGRFRYVRKGCTKSSPTSVMGLSRHEVEDCGPKGEASGGTLAGGQRVSNKGGSVRPKFVRSG